MSNPIDGVRRAPLPLSNTPDAPKPRVPEAPPPSPHTDATLRMFATAASPAVRDAAVQKQLDATRAAASGPYTLDGKSVSAPSHFRMTGGMNQIESTAHRAAKDPNENIFVVLQRAKLPASYAIVCAGRGTPEQLVKVTQALIDQGHCKGSGSAGDRIRAMQWEWGIGFDCAGYVQQALTSLPGASRAGLGLQQRADLEDFSSVATNKCFGRTAPEDARPGDVVLLDNPTEVGHRAIVYSNKPIDGARAKELDAKTPGAAKFLAGKGPLREIVVDSSWGADTGKWYGGVRQETWLYDASSKQWACVRPQEKKDTWALEVSPGPCGEKLVGVFHPKL